MDGIGLVVMKKPRLFELADDSKRHTSLLVCLFGLMWIIESEPRALCLLGKSSIIETYSGN